MSKFNETIRGIEDRLDLLQDNIQAIKDDLKILDSISTKIDVLTEQVKSHDIILNGNGSEGLKSKISRFEEIISVLKEKIDNIVTLLFGDLNNEGIKSKINLIDFKIGLISAIGGVAGAVAVTIMSDTIVNLIKKIF